MRRNYALTRINRIDMVMYVIFNVKFRVFLAVWFDIAIKTAPKLGFRNSHMFRFTSFEPAAPGELIG